MCGTCGCGSEDGGVRILPPSSGEGDATHHAHMHHSEHHSHHGHHHHGEHHHEHEGHHHSHRHHSHTHEHVADTSQKKVIEIEQDILQQNALQAARNRGYFEARNILTLNLVSSPGSGKTAILERTLEDMKDELKFYVIEGDQQTVNDADRIAAHNIPVRQINTGKGCHLESDMVYAAVKELKIEPDAVLMIENVGNLVCPSMFDLGEHKRVVIISITEGEDKPIKYPDMFNTSDLCLINKMDLQPYLNADIQRIKDLGLQVNPRLHFIEVSARTGAGMDQWYTWIKAEKSKI